MSSSIDSSPALIPAVARGDLAAFEAAYDRYSGTLYALLLRILGNAEDAQEVLQEAFVKVWTTARMFDAADALWDWAEEYLRVDRNNFEEDLDLDDTITS